MAMASNSSNNRAPMIGPEMEAETRLKALAENSEVDIDYSVKATRYVRSGREMLRSAVNYRDDGNLESSYVLYMRFLTIFVEKFHTHPGYKDVPDPERKLMSRHCRDVLPVAEALKAELLKKFKKEHEEYCIEKEKYRRKLEEFKKREEEERKRDAEKQVKQIVFDRGSLFSPLPYSAAAVPVSTSSKFKPAFTPSAPPINPTANYQTKPDSYYYSTFAGSDSINFHMQNGSSFQSTPEYDRKTKPSRMLSPNSSGLRPVIIPHDIGVCFMSLADSNTLRKIETCGVLMGKIVRANTFKSTGISGKLVITHLIIPNQKGTPDSCDMENEEDFIPIQDKHNIITIGWIHTHPTQTAFLSSVDLHTHYSYQLMMPEAIAIVCSPMRDETAVFTLTQMGIDVIGSCSATDFHPHPQTETPIFQEACHTTFDESRQITILDIRGGS